MKMTKIDLCFHIGFHANINLDFFFVYSFFQTFRPKKRFTQGTIRYSLHKQAQASLQSGINLRQVVKLPAGESRNDWIAVHGK